MSRDGCRIVLVGAATALILLGCRNATQKQDRAGRVTVTGRLTDAGQPLQVAGREVGIGMVSLKFYELDESGQPIDNDPEAEVTADEGGNFSVPAGGLPPGKYRIAVYQYDPYPNVDKLSGRFSLQKSPIVREVRGNATLEIDLSKP